MLRLAATLAVIALLSLLSLLAVPDCQAGSEPIVIRDIHAKPNPVPYLADKGGWATVELNYTIELKDLPDGPATGAWVFINGAQVFEAKYDKGGKYQTFCKWTPTTHGEYAVLVRASNGKVTVEAKGPTIRVEGNPTVVELKVVPHTFAIHRPLRAVVAMVDAPPTSGTLTGGVIEKIGGIVPSDVLGDKLAGVLTPRGTLQFSSSDFAKVAAKLVPPGSRLQNVEVAIQLFFDHIPLSTKVSDSIHLIHRKP